MANVTSLTQGVRPELVKPTMGGLASARRLSHALREGTFALFMETANANALKLKIKGDMGAGLSSVMQ
jgi:hypothetical protein